MESIQESGLALPVMNRVDAVEKEIELSDARLQLLKRRLEAVEFNSSREAAEVRLKLLEVQQNSPAEIERLIFELRQQIDRLEDSRENTSSSMNFFFVAMFFLLLLTNTAMLVWMIAGLRR